MKSLTIYFKHHDENLCRKTSSKAGVIFFKLTCCVAALPSWSTWRRSIRPPWPITGIRQTWSNKLELMNTWPGNTWTSGVMGRRSSCSEYESLLYSDITPSSTHTIISVVLKRIHWIIISYFCTFALLEVFSNCLILTAFQTTQFSTNLNMGSVVPKGHLHPVKCPSFQFLACFKRANSSQHFWIPLRSDSTFCT